MNFQETKNKIMLVLRKHTPEILIVSGVTGMICATVKACVDTHKKLPEKLKDHDQRMVLAHDVKDEKEQKKAITQAYARTGVDLAKIYFPSVTIVFFSSAAIFGSNIIMRKRMIALAAAYAAIDQSFKEYRSRVVERFGEDTDRELRFDIHKEQITTTETDEKGKEKKVKKTIEVVGENGLSDYARFFVKGEARAAEGNTDFDLFFLKAQQEVANHKLRGYGFLFLNEVYDMLGIQPSIAGQSVGWVYDKSCDENDNYVDFGIREVYRRNPDNPEEYEKVILLDFNVDGSILEHSVDNGLLTTT